MEMDELRPISSILRCYVMYLLEKKTWVSVVLSKIKPQKSSIWNGDEWWFMEIYPKGLHKVPEHTNMFQHAVRTRPLSSWSTRSQGDSTNSSDSEMTCWWGDKNWWTSLVQRSLNYSYWGNQTNTNVSLVLQIHYEKVFRHPKPTPKPLAEGIGAYGYGNFELFAHNVLFELVM